MALPPGYTIEGAPTQQQSGGLPPGYSLEQQPAQQTQPGVMAHLGAVISGMNPFPGLAQTVMHPVDAVTSQLNRMGELRGQAAQDFKKGNYNDALYHGLGGITPGIGPMASDFIDGIDPKGNSMDQAKQLGGLLMPAAMKAVPPIARVVGSGLKKGAVPVMESGLGVRAIDRGYGKTPGLLALEETSGVTPGAVGRTGRASLNRIGSGIEQAVDGPGPNGSLQPALDTVDNRIAEAGRGNNPAPEVKEFRSTLTTPDPAFQGNVTPSGEIATDQPASELWRMKKEFVKKHASYGQLKPTGDEGGTARQVVHDLGQSLVSARPEIADLNQRYSSLLPAVERAEQTDLNAGVVQNGLARLAAHGSAGIAGAALGYTQAGIPGAIAGAFGPAAIASPVTRIAAARALYGAGRGFGSTAAQRAAQAALLSGGLLMNGQRQKRGLLE